MQIKINITIPSSIEYIKFIRKTVNNICLLLQIESICIQDILVAICEATTNAIIHGSIKQSEVKIELIFTSNQLIITIENMIDNNSNITIPSNINNYKENGRGLFIINQIMDFVNIEQNNKHVKITLIKNYPIVNSTHSTNVSLSSTLTTSE